MAEATGAEATGAEATGAEATGAEATGADGIVFRPMVRSDLEAVVALLADDVLGRAREKAPDDPAYARAFAVMESQAGNSIIIADDGGAVVGCLQLIFIAGLSHAGMLRAEIEAVRVRADQRGRRLGERLMCHAIVTARESGVGLVQLTSNLDRADAHRFYERLGFRQTHAGFKLKL